MSVSFKQIMEQQQHFMRNVDKIMQRVDAKARAAGAMSLGCADRLSRLQKILADKGVVTEADFAELEVEAPNYAETAAPITEVTP